MNFKHCTYWIILLLVICLNYACEKEVILHELDPELIQLFNAHELPSLSACIIKNDSIVWSKVYGYSNLDQNIEAGEETIYHIASITKLFMMTAIMQLEEQGLIDLDDDISNFLPHAFRHPDYPEVAITTRMLLLHRAGLAWPKSYDASRGMWNQFDPDQSPLPSEWIPQFLLSSGEYYDHNLWKPYQPGTHEFYSNIGYCVLAYLIEQISSKSYREYCMDEIFTPLKMNSTSFDYADLDLEKIAIMYDRQGVGTAAYDNRVYASGGIKSTYGDLGRYAMCMMNGGELEGERILQDNTLHQMLEVHNEVSGRCLTWVSYPNGWYGHIGGLDMGATTTLMIHPESNTGIIIFTNTPSISVLPGGEIFWLVKQEANTYIN